MAVIVATKVDLSIILPALNEAAIIGDTLQKIAEYLHEHPELGRVEIVVVAAGTDATAEISRDLAGMFTAMHVVTPSHALGKGNDVKLGFRAAHGEVQLFLDVDLATPLHHIAPMVTRLRAGSDVVVGRRDLRRIHTGLARTLLSLASNLLIRVLFLPKIADSQCGFKGFTAAAAHTIFGSKLRVKGWAGDVEVLVMARRAGLRIDQMPIVDWHEARSDDLRDEGLGFAALRTLRDVLRLRVHFWGDSLVRHYKPIIFGAALLHACLAWLVAMKQSIWFDEAYSITLIEYPAKAIIRLTGVDVHPPLYYLTLKAWASLFGTTDMALRSLSILCGGLAIVVGLFLVKRLWGARTALYAVPFVVLAPFLLRYSFEIRMYAMASLICVTATYVLVAAMEQHKRLQHWLLWIAYGLLVAVGVYTLYYTALVWLAHLIWYIYARRSDTPPMPWKKLLLQPLVLADAVAAGLFIAWLPSFLLQLHEVQQWFWIGPVSYRTVINVWSQTTSYLSDDRLGPWQSVYFIFAVVAAFYLVITALQASTGKARRGMVLLILYAIVPIVCLYAVSLPPRQPLFTARYDSHVVLATYLLLGVATATVVKHRKSLLVRLVVVGLWLVLLQGVIHLYQAGNEHPYYKQLADYIQTAGVASQPIVAPGIQEYMILHHYLPGRSIFFYAGQPISTTGGYAPLHDSPLQVSNLTSFAGKSVWLVYSRAVPPYIPANYMPLRGTYLAKSGYHVYLYVPSGSALLPIFRENPKSLHPML